MLKTKSLDISDKVPFLHLCEMFERMTTAKNGKQRKIVLHKFVDQYVNLTNNFYPVMRLMAPEADYSRVYGIKERTLASIIIDAYGISPKSDDGKKLLEWREGNGDLCQKIYSLALARSTTRAKWTLKHVNDFLDELSSIKTTQSKKECFCKVISKLRAKEVKWLCKIILKKLRYGSSRQQVLNAFHPGASDVFAYQADLERVCNLLQTPDFHIDDAKHLELFVPFQPMLASRRKPLDIPKTMD